MPTMMQKCRQIGFATILAIGTLMISGTQAYAACANPVGLAGDMMYNADHSVMQYCDGTDWTAMKDSGGGGSDNLGNHTATTSLLMGANNISMGTDNLQTLDGNNAATLNYDANHSTTTQIRLRDLENAIYGSVYGSGDGANFGLLDADSQWLLLHRTDNSTEFRVNNTSEMRLYPTYLDLYSNKISNVADPTVAQDAATKKYVDDEIAASGGSDNLGAGGTTTGAVYSKSATGYGYVGGAAGAGGSYIRYDTTPAASAGRMYVNLNNNWEYVLHGTYLGPYVTNVNDLGTSGVRWKDGWFAGTVTAGTFAGSGASLTALNAAQLTSGTIPAARIGTGTVTSTHIADATIVEADLAASVGTASNVVNRIVKRNANGDFTGRYINGTYMNMSHAAGNRTADTVFYSSTDNYIRKNNKASFRTALDVYSKAETDSAITAGAANADTVDSLHASSFIRADASDVVTAPTRWNDSQEVRLGTGNDFRMMFNGTNTYLRGYGHGAQIFIANEDAAGTMRNIVWGDPDNETRLYYAGAEKINTTSTGIDVNSYIHLLGKEAFRGSDTWLRLNQAGAFTSGTYTPGMLRADGGYQVDGNVIINGSGTVTGSRVGSGVNGDNITDGTIDSSEIQDNTLTQNDLAAGSVRGSEILDGSIVATTELSATGTKNSTTFLAGNNTWRTVTAGNGCAGGRAHMEIYTIACSNSGDQCGPNGTGQCRNGTNVVVTSPNCGCGGK